jgi:acyl carrier protein
MPAQLELLTTARDAVALVCGVDLAQVDESTDLDALGADSLARVGIADVIEAELARAGVTVQIDDATLAKVATVGELAEFVSAHSAAKPPAAKPPAATPPAAHAAGH